MSSSLESSKSHFGFVLDDNIYNPQITKREVFSAEEVSEVLVVLMHDRWYVCSFFFLPMVFG